MADRSQICNVTSSTPGRYEWDGDACDDQTNDNPVHTLHSTSVVNVSRGLLGRLRAGAERICLLQLRFDRGAPDGCRCRRKLRAELVPFLFAMTTTMNFAGVQTCAHGDVPPRVMAMIIQSFGIIRTEGRYHPHDVAARHLELRRHGA